MPKELKSFINPAIKVQKKNPPRTDKDDRIGRPSGTGKRLPKGRKRLRPRAFAKTNSPSSRIISTMPVAKLINGRSCLTERLFPPQPLSNSVKGSSCRRRQASGTELQDSTHFHQLEHHRSVVHPWHSFQRNTAKPMSACPTDWCWRWCATEIWYRKPPPLPSQESAGTVAGLMGRKDGCRRLPVYHQPKRCHHHSCIRPTDHLFQQRQTARYAGRRNNLQRRRRNPYPEKVKLPEPAKNPASLWKLPNTRTATHTTAPVPSSLSRPTRNSLSWMPYGTWKAYRPSRPKTATIGTHLTDDYEGLPWNWCVSLPDSAYVSSTTTKWKDNTG